MATRMQQRRGTAAQWISTNSGNGPILNAGEIGFETDTNKFKIGDGTNHWVNLDYFIDASSTVNPAFGSSITFEGATANDFETTLAVTDPTADRTITFPDATGTVALTSDISELSQDAIDSALTAGTGITKTYNDGANTLTIAVDTTAIQARVTDVSDTEIGYLNGVTSAIQTQLDDKSTASKTETLTNKSISLGSNTVTSTLAQLNTAVSDADVASLAGSETLTNKTIAFGSNTVSGTLAQFNTAVTDADLATLAGTETLTNKTLTSPKINEDVAVTATATELNYVDGVTSAIQTQLNALAPKADPTFTGTISAAALTLSGDLTVNGTTTTINSTTLAVDDKNIVLGDVATPSDVTADGGGITLKGATDKTFNWVDSTDAWTSSEHINLASGKTLKYNGTNLIAAQSGNSGKYLTTDGTSTSWGTVSGYSAPTLGSTTISSGDTVSQIDELTLFNPEILISTGTAGSASFSGTSSRWAGTGNPLLTTSNLSSVPIGATLTVSNTLTSETTVFTTTSVWSAGSVNVTRVSGSTGIDAANNEYPDASSNISATWLPAYNTISSVELKYLDGITSNVQTQLNAISVYSAPTLGSTSIASGATVTTIAGLTLTAPTLTGTVTASGDINLSAAGGPGSVIDELALMLMGAI
jgi:hypothetical protein